MVKFLDSSFSFKDIQKKVSGHFFGDCVLTQTESDLWTISVLGKSMDAYRVKKYGSQFKFERIYP